jgi:Ca2+-binding EF-hand superfamily protein
MSVFKRIDTDGSGTIDKSETIKFWLIFFTLLFILKCIVFLTIFIFNHRKSNFAKVNTEELFRAVDLDNNGDISEEEWMEFW